MVRPSISFSGTASPNTTIEPEMEIPPDCSEDICAPRLFDLDKTLESETKTYRQLINAASDLNIGWKQNASISPGYYRNLRATGKNEISLTVGDYYFKSISTGTQSQLKLDLSDRESAENGYKGINIFVDGKAFFGDKLSIEVRSSSSAAYKTMTGVDKALAGYVYLQTEDTCTLNDKASWFGTILSQTLTPPSPALVFISHLTLIGSFHAVDGPVSGSSHLDITYVTSQFAMAHRDLWECP